MDGRRGIDWRRGILIVVLFVLLLLVVFCSILLIHLSTSLSYPTLPSMPFIPRGFATLLAPFEVSLHWFSLLS